MNDPRRPLFVAVLPHKRSLGVHGPGHPSGTSDWRCLPERPENTRRVSPVPLVELSAALSIHYRTDAHLVTYQMALDGEPVQLQPRVNKTGGGLAWVRELGYELTHAFLAVDVDNPGHVAWTPATLERFYSLWRDPPASLRTCGGYVTQHGYRLIQPLETPARAGEDVERVIRAWHERLLADGIQVDVRCRDWTRLFRLPNVVRAVVPYVSPMVDLSRMAPVDIPPAPKAPPACVGGGRGGNAPWGPRPPRSLRRTRRW